MRQRGRSEQPVKGRRANRPRARTKARRIAAPSVADLQKQVSILTRESKEANERQTATVEVLQVINSSPGDLALVFKTILEKAHSLCAVAHGALLLYDGEKFRAVAVQGLSEALAERLRRGYVPGPNHPSQRLLEGKRFSQVLDWAEIDDPIASTALGAGVRTTLFIPLRRKEKLLGQIGASRLEARPFTEKEIALLENFAAQAVIAMENARLFEELRQSLQQQTATADVLKVISRSAFDLKSVLQTLVESAARLCDADKATITRQIGGGFYRAETYGFSDEFMDHVRNIPIEPERGSANGRVLLEGKAVHVLDVEVDPEYTFMDAARLGGFHTVLAVPILREGVPIGALALTRSEVRAFTDKQIELVSTFADQAAIAIENARLLGELRQRTGDLTESLQQQTATADVLRVIASSPTDVKPVLKAIVESACELCEANDALVALKDGDDLVFQAQHGGSIPVAWQRRPIDRGWITGRAVADSVPVHVRDVLASEGEEFPGARELSGRDTTRTLLAVPLLREGESIGAIVLRRAEVHPFSDKQIALLQTFANQAVIAIGNVRLFDEVQARTCDLEQSLEQQTSTADVLKIISRSTFDLETVLEAVTSTALRLCEADMGFVSRRDGEQFRFVMGVGSTSEQTADALHLIHLVTQTTRTFTAGRGSITGRVVQERQPVQIADIAAEPEYTFPEAVTITKIRTILGVPMLREGEPIGTFTLARQRVEPFTDRQIDLVRTFADQAAIAIENVRLIEELRDRQAELRVTFDNMGDGVVMFGADTHLVAWNRNFQEILDLPDAFLRQRPSSAEYFRHLADRGEYSSDLETELSRTIEDTSREMRFERTRPDGRVIEVRRNPVPGGGFVLIYADITERKRAEVAIRAARDAAETALRDLQAAQDRLVQTQKLASLGQLTAGIAHEIKNPLNFVNNFSALSVELTDELNDVLKQATFADKIRAEVNELASLLKDNLGKVVQHGKRADAIVKNMLLHSREGSGEHRPTDINALIDESLNLAYHGARAEKAGFHITLQRDLDPATGTADVYPQEITRVLLNLISNGFYAATKRAAEIGDGFEPTLKAATKNLGDKVEIRIRDNGAGIPSGIKEKIFNPFFTTKPAGEGTGLGLSMSHDIVVKQHGGKIDVDTKPDTFTEFIITLPRTTAEKR